MKNKLIKGLFAFGLMVSLFNMANVNVYAVGGTFDNGGTIVEDDLSDREVSVVVGEVDVPVYNVELSWTSMQFNYRYDEITSSYIWKVTDECKLIESIDETYLYDSLHGDSWCSSVYEDENLTDAIEEGMLYGKILGGKITIVDSSSLGNVIPSIEWSSNEGYEAVQANFKYNTWDNICDESNENCEYEFVSHNLNLNLNGKTELPEETRVIGGCMGGPDWSYCESRFYLNLSLNTNTSLGTVKPTKGDVVGHLTISFRGKSIIE